MEKDPTGLRIAHLSDPHFFHISYHPRQFLSKRWIGNFNLLFFRKHAYQTGHLWHLPELCSSLNVETVFITGDFSSTSLDEEFLEGKKFILSFKEKELPVYYVPGNHDCYTRHAQQEKTFYKFLSSDSLKSKGVEKIQLAKKWWYIGLDCALATPPLCSYGLFSKQTEQYLVEALLTIPPTHFVIIGNHFPLFATNRPHHDLKRAHALQAVLKEFPQVKLYLHGHDHTHYIVDRQSEGYPLVLNSGSCAHKPNGSFFLIDLFEKECLIQHLLFRQENLSLSWSIDWQKHYDWTSR